ncbi:hypothetical protein BCR43DRAFT_502157 [Syncephalastrum racemosum]|uniref:Uncharacterized protein n=1 Tax=Syncephalastrum racemosum TaxID=13706 RepID=A0A1X2HM41_SYNRA|nr:hypothetical protein BCR43DRAFT_502157 [Syncephalastrum racemosum]
MTPDVFTRSLLPMILVNETRSCLRRCTSNTDVAICQSGCMEKYWPDSLFFGNHHNEVSENLNPAVLPNNKAGSGKIMKISEQLPTDTGNEAVALESSILDEVEKKNNHTNMSLVGVNSKQNQQNEAKFLEVSYGTRPYDNMSSKDLPAEYDQTFPTGSLNTEMMEASPETVTVTVFSTHTSRIDVTPAAHYPSSKGANSIQDIHSAAGAAHPTLAIVAALALSLVTTTFVA